MDGSKKVERVFKTKRPNRYAQRHFVRCTDIESAMEYEDSFEPVQRHVDHVKTTEPEQGKRTQPSRIRPEVRVSED